MKLRKLGKDEILQIFEILKIEANDRNIVLNHYFVEGTSETDFYSFKNLFDEDNLKSDEIDKINPNISTRIKYYATTERDLNLELLAPELLQQFSEPNRIVFFIGAGLSRLLEYPSWERLAELAIEKLRERKIINFYTVDRINHTIKDPLQKLSIFESIFDHNSDEYKEFYTEVFGNKTKEFKKNPYDLLVKQEFNAAFITTNIDIEIIKALSKKDTTTNS